MFIEQNLYYTALRKRRSYRGKAPGRGFYADHIFARYYVRPLFFSPMAMFISSTIENEAIPQRD